MPKFIRVGDKTSHGGTVLSGSSTLIVDGIPVARKGDPVSCPIEGHGPTTITSGNPHFLDGDGLEVAFDGDSCGCGATLISSIGAAAVD